MDEPTEHFTKEYTDAEKPWGNWIDGSVIYAKTIDFGDLPDTSTKSVAHGISNLAQIVRFEGIAYAGQYGWYPLPLTYGGSDTNYNVEFRFTTSDIVAKCTQDRSMFSAYITLFYTKTEAEND